MHELGYRAPKRAENRYKHENFDKQREGSLQPREGTPLEGKLASLKCTDI